MNVEAELSKMEGDWNCKGCTQTRHDIYDPVEVTQNAQDHEGECDGSFGPTCVHLRWYRRDD